VSLLLEARASQVVRNKKSELPSDVTIKFSTRELLSTYEIKEQTKDDSKLQTDYSVSVISMEDFRKDFKKIKEIRRSKYSVLWQGTFRHRTVAYKRTKRNKHAIKSINFEANILSLLAPRAEAYGVPRIICKVAKVIDGKCTTWGIAMVWVNGPTLAALVDSKPSLFFRLSCALQAARIYERLHDHNPRIIIRDIKPSNIIVSLDGTVVVCDFGLARFDDDDTSHAAVGTKDFVAPELIEGTEKGMTTEADMYSFGVTLGCVIGDSDTSGHCLSLVSDCQTKDPSRRPSIAQAIERLILCMTRVSHPSPNPDNYSDIVST